MKVRNTLICISTNLFLGNYGAYYVKIFFFDFLRGEIKSIFRTLGHEKCSV